MEYTCRISNLHKIWTHRLDGDTLKLMDSQGAIRQASQLGKVRRIQQYAGFAVSDPKTGPYDAEYCKIVPAQGPLVCLRNGSYVQPFGKIGEMVVNRNVEYAAFLTELKRRVASENPDVRVIYGWLLASLAWWSLVPLGMFLFAFTIGGLLMDELVTALGIAAFCLPSGLMCFMCGFSLGRVYWPSRTTVAEDLKSRKPDVDLSAARSEALA